MIFQRCILLKQMFLVNSYIKMMVTSLHIKDYKKDKIMHTCDSDILTGVMKTVQVTLSKHGGVVRPPLYRKYVGFSMLLMRAAKSRPFNGYVASVAKR